jgi:hypothetical protein
MLTSVKAKRGRPARKPDDTAFIYGLVCPHAGVVRYVGRTYSPYERLFGHIARATNDATKKWMAALIAEGRVPVVLTLEVTTQADAVHREHEWIRYYGRRHGELLLNRSGRPGVVTGSRPGPGRPLTNGEGFKKSLLIRTSPDRIENWKRAAGGERALSDWIRRTLDAAAGGPPTG